MSRRTISQPDSLEMLLDTMCNTFGGIILIALLIALLARDTKVKEAETRAVTENEAMLQRRIASVEKDLADVRAQQTALERQARESAQSGLLSMIEARQRLRQLRGGLADVLRNAHQKLDAGPAANAGQVEQAIRQMLQKLNASEQRQTEARALETSLKERQRELQLTLQQDSNRLAQAIARRVQRLRLPREHATTKTHLYVIVRYGRLYPFLVYRDGEPERNTTSLRWIDETPTTRRVEPLPTLGVPVTNEGALAPFFRQFPADSLYLVFEVYEDSFAAFIAAKAAAIAQGFEYTWQPRRNGEVLRTGGGGAPPPPQ